MRTETITQIRGPERRDFLVHYTAPAPERLAAITYFRQFDDPLHPCVAFIDDIWPMGVDAANAHLAANPILETFDALYLQRNCEAIRDTDLSRLTQLPELTGFHIHSDTITDAAVPHIATLQHLENLRIFSPLLTDACLPLLQNLPSLQYLDLQSSPKMTRPAFDALVGKLPNIVDAWGPRS